MRSGAILAGLLCLPLAVAGCGSAGSPVAGSASGGVTDPITALAIDSWRAVASSPVSASMPALNVWVLDALAAHDPRLVAHRATLEAEEREAVRAVLPRVEPIAALAQWSQRLQRPLRPRPRRLLDQIIPTAHAAEGGWGTLQTSGAGANFTRFAGGGLTTGGAPNTQISRNDAPGGKASFTVSTDASGVPEATLETRAEMPLFLMDADSKLSIKTAGLCPDASGQVSLTIRLQQGGKAGAAGYSGTIEAQVTATVNDDAEIASADIQTHYSQRSSGASGSTTVEGRTGWSVAGGMPQNTSHSATGDEAATQKGMLDALNLGQGALQAAESHWKGGACIRIQARSPGSVNRNARSEIPVSVVHRLEGGEIAAKLTASLTGGDSLDPLRLAPTPGTLTHIAPDEKDARMSIRLTAVSRRGKAEETLQLSVSGDQYDIEGGADEFHGTGLICDLAQPFEVQGSGVTVKFTPNSESGGSYTYSGSMSGFGVSGHGTYTVSRDGEVATRITASGPGSVKTPIGVVTNNGTELYTLTPTRNASCD